MTGRPAESLFGLFRIVPNAGVGLRCSQVMSVSVKPWLAARQPSSKRRGAPGDDQAVPRTVPQARARGGERIGTEVTAVRQTPERFAVITVDARCRVTTRYSRRHIDLQRVATALCPA
ncbi:hypothetical protein GCM10009665_25810 [Kitasatospora nipponensis]|uniref:Uncharacterized protein n=1 Tax=Kitasatospora nipponensis TaxID=258049 RepID=A0ABN1W846_9ACTN